MANAKITWLKPAIVYQITNLVNGHRYIGVTIRDLHRRWSSHRHEAKRKSRRPIVLALQKYGPDLFNIALIERCKTYGDALAEERRLIALLRPEYNATAGGEGTLGYRLPPEVLARVVAKRTGVKRAQPYPRESIERAKATRAVNGTVPRYWLGKKRYPETVAKVVATQRAIGHYDKLSAAYSKSLRCIEDGNVFDSLGAAARHYGTHKSILSLACRGLRTPRSGLHFEYLEAA